MKTEAPYFSYPKRDRYFADPKRMGRADGIDDAYITPLVVVKAAMTENLLAKPVAS